MGQAYSSIYLTRDQVQGPRILEEDYYQHKNYDTLFLQEIRFLPEKDCSTCDHPWT